MNDTDFEMIFKRKSFHLFQNVATEKLTAGELCEIKLMIEKLCPLDSRIKTDIRIVPAEETSCRRGEEACILFFSEKKENYLQNIGYLGEQLDLFLVSKNIGTLWFGIGRPQHRVNNGLEFEIMMAISKIQNPDDFRKDVFKSKRKPVEEIWSGQPIPGVTDLVRFAPSACNTQPWLVVHENSVLKVFRVKKPGKRGIMPVAKVSFYNQIDLGIFLCFLEVCLQHNSIKFEKKLLPDAGQEEELTLAAIYELE